MAKGGRPCECIQEVGGSFERKVWLKERSGKAGGWGGDRIMWCLELCLCAPVKNDEA